MTLVVDSMMVSPPTYASGLSVKLLYQCRQVGLLDRNDIRRASFDRKRVVARCVLPIWCGESLTSFCDEIGTLSSE